MEDFSNKIVVVTGGAGFIGSHLVDALVERGAKVRVIDDLSTGKKENLAQVMDRIEFTQDSILNPEALATVFAGADYVFHQAAIPSVPRSVKDPMTSHNANATGSLCVLLAARDAKVKRVVVAGSSSYYGDTPTLPKVETMPPNPLSPYALQKFVAEKYAMMFYKLYGLETVIVRYFNIFGPRQDPNSPYSAVIPIFIKQMKAGIAPTVNGDGTASRGFTFIDDTVAANLAAAIAPNVGGEVFNVSGWEQTSINDLIAKINALLGTSIVPIYGPERLGDIKHSFADVSKAERMLGWKPLISFEEGLKRTAESIE
ncbi:MAG TPA: SDR family oxidoreductase [Candidatus Paceibacterota bacterium]|nr:SDR family oxidoreductase [Candidatus Paceibacterota bacterium]